MATRHWGPVGATSNKGCCLGRCHCCHSIHCKAITPHRHLSFFQIALRISDCHSQMDNYQMAATALQPFTSSSALSSPSSASAASFLLHLQLRQSALFKVAKMRREAAKVLLAVLCFLLFTNYFIYTSYTRFD